MTDRSRPSQLEAARVAFRQRLLDTEAGATETVARQYVETRRTLLRQIDALEREIGEAGITDASQLFRMNRYNALLAQVDTEIAALGKTIIPTIADTQGIVVRNGVEEVRQLSIASAAETSRTLALKVAGQWSMLPRDALAELVGSLSDGSPLAEWVNGFGPDIAAKITATLRDGLTLGFHPRKITDQLTRVIDGGGTRLMLGTRSIILDSYRSAALQQMAANADVLDGWVWQSAHDSRTCGACLALDNGEIHPVTETFMGSHAGCRCNPRPVVTGVAPPSRQTGEQYFATLPPEQQDRTLGIAAGQAFRDGKVSLRDFVHKDTDERWGDRFRQGSLRDALARSGGEGGRSGLSGGKVQGNGAGTQQIPQPLDSADVVQRVEAASFDNNKAATAWREQAFPRWDKQFAAAELEAVSDYRASGYAEINRFLRGGEDRARQFLADDGQAKSFIDHRIKEIPGVVDQLDKAVARTTLDRDLTLWRGMSTSRLGDLDRLTGSVITDNGFTSTSIRQRVAEKFVGYAAEEGRDAAVLRILAPKGSNALPVDALYDKVWEEEFLLPRGSRFRVVRVDQSEGQAPVITLELLS